jgi:hypothetical protein
MPDQPETPLSRLVDGLETANEDYERRKAEAYRTKASGHGLTDEEADAVAREELDR